MNDQELKDQIKKSVAQISDNLDGEMLSKLNQARHAALDYSAQKNSSSWLGWSIAGSSVAAALVLVITMNQPQLDSSKLTTGAFIQDVEILAQESELDFYADLEFVDWLAFNDLELEAYN